MYQMMGLFGYSLKSVSAIVSYQLEYMYDLQLSDATQYVCFDKPQMFMEKSQLFV
jgi:hypothetical protein